MSQPKLRPLHADEYTHIDQIVRQLRKHFHEWPEYLDREFELIDFAFYEGHGRSHHCGQILAKAAPFALGKVLTQKHGFEWRMLITGNRAEYVVIHGKLDAPICLQTLESGAWNHTQYDEPPAPGEITHDSLPYIIRATKHLTHLP